jgi:iron-sulfur cluster assembly accessory protein
MEMTLELPVQFTSSATAEIRRLMDVNPGKYLRVGVKGGGCSGLSYVLGFDDMEASDEQYDHAGIPVIMNRAHGIYLAGMEIDWQDGLNARGFSFSNPNASKTCGCGTSFSV